MDKNLIVVIREAGERTFDLCRKLVEKQVVENTVFIVNEFPFEAALRRCYQIGIESRAKWMMTLDADVLLRDNAVSRLLSESEKLPENYFQMEGLVFDKFTGLYRNAGHRFYRVDLLKLAIEQLPEDRTEIRPEYATIQKMERMGYPSFLINEAFGIHDYEQYYCDIYRKAFVHANKHQKWLTHFIERWKKLGTNDDDYKIALKGLCDGLVSLREVTIDARDLLAEAEKGMNDLCIKEKSPLSFKQFDSKQIEIILSNAGDVLNERKPDSIESKFKRLKNKWIELGLFRFPPYLLGSIFCDIGKKIKQWVGQGNYK